MQLDIFEHSRDVMLRNDVLHALQQRDRRLARAVWLTLADDCPRDPQLHSLEALVARLELPPLVAFANHTAAEQALQTLQDNIEPAARQVLGDTEGKAWLVPLWQELAQCAQALPFEAAHSEVHAAALWLRAGDFQAAADAARRIASWRRIPAPLAWMTEARWHLQGLDACWALLAELAWLAPARLATLTPRLADPLLQRLRKQFDARFEGDGNGNGNGNGTHADLAWFPAWLLIDKPALAQALGLAQPGLDSAGERAMRVLLDLLHLERQGRQRDLPAKRRVLRDLHGGLYADYLKTRGGSTCPR
jgi:hypothetical protein